jgi:hypothetical protein
MKDNYEKLNIVIYTMRNITKPLSFVFACGTDTHNPGV